MTQVSEMPAHIWAFEDEPNSGAVPRAGIWIDERSECPDGAPEYRRTDIPLTPPEAMRCPEVMALVEALRSASSSLEAIALHSPSKGSSVVAEAARRRSVAALTALEQAVHHE